MYVYTYVIRMHRRGEDALLFSAYARGHSRSSAPATCSLHVGKPSRRRRSGSAISLFFFPFLLCFLTKGKVCRQRKREEATATGTGLRSCSSLHASGKRNTCRFLSRRGSVQYRDRVGRERRCAIESVGAPRGSRPTRVAAVGVAERQRACANQGWFCACV